MINILKIKSKTKKYLKKIAVTFLGKFEKKKCAHIFVALTKNFYLISFFLFYNRNLAFFVLGFDLISRMISASMDMKHDMLAKKLKN